MNRPIISRMALEKLFLVNDSLMKKILLLLMVAGLACCEEIKIEFEYPSFYGDFYLTGSVLFPPSSVFDVTNIIVADARTKKEIPSKIIVQQQWFDGSILEAQITFPANINRKTEYCVIYGIGVQRKNPINELAVLTTVPFYTPGYGRAEENIDVPVGQINVRIDKSSNIRYWWYIFPMSFLIILTFIRSMRINRQ